MLTSNFLMVILKFGFICQNAILCSAGNLTKGASILHKCSPQWALASAPSLNFDNIHLMYSEDHGWHCI